MGTDPLRIYPVGTDPLRSSIMSTYEIVNGIFGYPPPAIGKLTAGVDCNGFVQESAA